GDPPHRQPAASRLDAERKAPPGPATTVPSCPAAPPGGPRSWARHREAQDRPAQLLPGPIGPARRLAPREQLVERLLGRDVAAGAATHVGRVSDQRPGYELTHAQPPPAPPKG